MKILWGGKIRVIFVTYTAIHHPCQSYLPPICEYCAGSLLTPYLLLPLKEGRDEGKVAVSEAKNRTWQGSSRNIALDIDPKWVNFRWIYSGFFEQDPRAISMKINQVLDYDRQYW
ncbi:MAG: hypothetical protein ACLFRF_06915 [Desulfobacterales bacterium]